MATRMVKCGVLLLAAAVVFAGCTAAEKGAGIGAAGGALAGGIIGHQSGHKEGGALIGAALGGLGGYAVGNEMDKKKVPNQATQAQVQAQAAQDAANTVIINVQNTNGSITPVVLRRNGNIYIGPRGEQYTALPTEEQLRKIYGF